MVTYRDFVRWEFFLFHCVCVSVCVCEGLTGRDTLTVVTSTHQHYQDSLLEPYQAQTSCIIDEVLLGAFASWWETEAEQCDSK